MRAIAIAIATGCVIWGLMASGAAFAQDDDVFARDGVYLVFQGDYFPQNFDLPELEAANIEADGGWGATGRIGYRFHPRGSAELQFDWVKNFDFGSDDAKSGTKFFKINNGLNASANGKFYILTGRFQPYAVFGLGLTSFQLQTGASDPVGSRATGFMYRGGARHRHVRQ